MRIFIGIDPRDAISYNVLQWSIIRRASQPVSICPLILPQFRLKRTGLTDFTYTRYLVPQLCGFKGKALFLDSDMMCLGDIGELFDHPFEDAVAVVKCKERFEWPSLMMFNNELCQKLTFEYVNHETTKPQSFEWCDGVGDLPSEWNHCVGYDEPKDAKMIHFTSGTPGFKERRNCEYSEQWFSELESMNSQTSWLEVHGHSVHFNKVMQELWPESQQKPH